MVRLSMSLHSSSKMQPLIEAIRTCLPGILHEFNTVRLPQLEAFLGRTIIEEFPDPVKRTSETTKVIARGLDNTFFRHIHAVLPEFVEDEGDGRDYRFGAIPIESKNTFGKGDSWTGNGYDKTGLHLLKKFQVNERGHITHAFIALVNIDDCESCWSEKTLKSNFSSLMLRTVDKEKVHVIVGSLKSNPKNLSPILAPVAPAQTSETPD
jgi:hypothetical protein